MPSRNRRRARNVTVAIILLGLAAWIVPSYFSAERYRRRLQTGLEQALHRPVKFGALSFRLIPRPGFTIENVEIGEDPDFGSEPFARVDHIDCSLAWHSLWRSRMDFARLHLDHPSFNIDLNSRGEWNVGKLLIQSGVTTPSSARPAARTSAAAEQLNLDAVDSRINFQLGPDKKPFALTDVQARLQINPSQRRVQFHITASPVRSDMAIPTPGPVDVEGVWTPGADLRGPIDARLRTRGTLLYDLIPVVTGKNPQVYGVLDFDARLTGSLHDLTVDGQTNLTQLHRWEQLPPSDAMPWTIRFRGQLVRGTGRVVVESLDASFADSHLHLSGSVDSLKSRSKVDLVMSIEHSRLEDVLSAARRLWPIAASWNMRGRVDAMLAIQGPWAQRHYGGFVGIRDVSLDTPSGSFPISDIAVHINNRGASLTPVQVNLAPRVALSVQGAIQRTKLGPRYEVQLAAKGVPLHDAVSFGRGLGVHAFQDIDATGSTTASLHLSGTPWPLARPAVRAGGEIRAARLLIPGLTEPLNVPHASWQIVGDRITADPVVAVLGTSVFNARLVHEGARTNPWQFDVHANTLSLEEGALWFDALGLRRPVPLLQRLPGLSSLASRREAAARIFAGLNATGRFATRALSYRSATLTNFEGTFDVTGRTIRMSSATFRTEGGRGEADGAADLTGPRPALSAKASIVGMSLQPLAAHLSGPARSLQGSMNATGNFQTRGLAREELADNLSGNMELRVKDVAFGDFDPLAALARQGHWGQIEAARGPITAAPTVMYVTLRDRRATLRTTRFELGGGADLQLAGSYAWGGALNLTVRTDLRHLRRHWVLSENDPHPPARGAEIRLAGSIEHLAINPQDGAASQARSRRLGNVR